jgi:hypothetical protein
MSTLPENKFKKHFLNICIDFVSYMKTKGCVLSKKENEYFPGVFTYEFVKDSSTTTIATESDYLDGFAFDYVINLATMAFRRGEIY